MNNASHLQAAIFLSVNYETRRILLADFGAHKLQSHKARY